MFHERVKQSKFDQKGRTRQGVKKKLNWPESTNLIKPVCVACLRVWQSKQANVLGAWPPVLSVLLVQSVCGPSIVFSIRQTSAFCKVSKIVKSLFWARPILSSKGISALFRISAQSAWVMFWFWSLEKDAQLFSEQRPSISNHRFLFALKILYGHGTQPGSAEHAQPPRIIAYKWIKPRCPQSFSNIMAQPSYNVHRYHARNVGTLCASLTMRRGIVATRRAGLTTAVIKRIPPKGKQCAWCIHIMPMTEELF